MVGGTVSESTTSFPEKYNLISQDTYDEVASYLKRFYSKRRELGEWQYYFLERDIRQIVRVNQEDRKIEFSTGLGRVMAREIRQIIMDKYRDIK